jgi:two-component system chemotaxis response regulator CheB
MQKQMTAHDSLSAPIKILIADDSWVFRHILRDIFKKMQHIQVVDDASNGVEALEQIIKFKPHVLLLDMEMPIMDGITTLQHLMIHTPTPTIIFSSLSQEGTTRAFDALKYGAVDFVAKSSFFKGRDMAADRELIIKKVLKVAAVTVHTIDPMQAATGQCEKIEPQQLIFCEDCGARNIIDTETYIIMGGANCFQCGDELKLSQQAKLHRLSHVIIIGAGEGGFVNLLQIVPALCSEMGAAVIAILHDEPEKVASFVDYLGSISAINVVRGQDGLTMEGGSCYIFSAGERVSFSPYSGHFVLRVISDSRLNPMAGKQGAINTALLSAAPLLKEKLAGILLSGSENDGIKGMEAIRKYKGRVVALTPSRCLCKEMTKQLIRKFPDVAVTDEQGLIKIIKELEQQHRKLVVTA